MQLLTAALGLSLSLNFMSGLVVLQLSHATMKNGFSSTDIFGAESFTHLNIAMCCQKYGNNESNAHERRVKSFTGWLVMGRPLSAVVRT